MKKRMVQCSSLVNKDAIRRESIHGVEHIIVSSFTMPDDVVMNGVYYAAAEIAASFKTLERTLAPVEHPTDIDGNFLSATDPVAIHDFHAGAFNVNVTQDNGRIHIEKHINVQEALKSEKGKRLLDRVEEIETNESPRAIHTSTGIFLEIEDFAEPQTNAAGEEYMAAAHNMVFDHDAILLNSIGAATPEQGVGMAVNADGVKFEVERVTLDAERPPARDMRTNQDGMGLRELETKLQEAINGIVTADWLWLVDVFDDRVIFETPQGFNEVQWTMADGRVAIGIPFRVDKKVEYVPRGLANNGGKDEMKEKILAALNEAKIEVEGLTDDQLFEKYNEVMAANAAEAAKPPEGSEDLTGVANVVATALAPITEAIATLTAKVNQTDTDELNKLSEIVGNSDQHPGITAEEAKLIPLATLKSMAANCATAHGLSLEVNLDGDDGFAAPADMPE